MTDDISAIINDPLLQNWFQKGILDSEFLSNLRQQFMNATPFSHVFIDDLLQEEKLDLVTEELSQQEFEYKQSDLFSLYQTLDFEDLEAPNLLKFREVMRSKAFVSLMEYVTTLDLSDQVDCLGNIYMATDHLLCHDDELLRRKIAYILYLTDLEEDTGGALHLFNSVNGQPDQVVKKIYPKQNRLTFFKVTRASFHEVGEVIKDDVYRVSISGWFNRD